MMYANWTDIKISFFYGLLLFVITFRGVQDFLNHEHRVFNSEEFLRTREPADQLFYKKVRSHSQRQKHAESLWLSLLHVCHCCCLPQVLDTHIFHSFLRDRLNRKWDAFSRMEQNTRDHVHRCDVIKPEGQSAYQMKFYWFNSLRQSSLF